ncbi:hypothetical protein M2273_004559 [Mucilaginibacter lappiensis]
MNLINPINPGSDNNRNANQNSMNLINPLNPGSDNNPKIQ